MIVQDSFWIFIENLPQLFDGACPFLVSLVLYHDSRKRNFDSVWFNVVSPVFQGI